MTWTVMMERGKSFAPLLRENDTKYAAMQRATALADLHSTPDPVINDDLLTIKIDASTYYDRIGSK